MTDARTPIAGTGTEYPDFELLSCFADGELAGAVAPEVTAHIGGCVRCETLTGRLREGFGGAEAQPDGGVGSAGCIGEERLVLYASRGLQGDDRAVIAAHVSGCDPCVAALVRLHRRLSVLADVAAPVPASVYRRAQAVLPAALAEIAPRRAPARVQPTVHQSAPGLLERLRGWVSIPVMAPLAVGALALFAVAVGLRPSSAPSDAERSRALAPAAVRMRVTGETTLYSRPSGNSDALGPVSRGAGAEVAGEERDWYQVRLEDGRSGWIVREAFE